MDLKGVQRDCITFAEWMEAKVKKYEDIANYIQSPHCELSNHLTCSDVLKYIRLTITETPDCEFTDRDGKPTFYFYFSGHGGKDGLAFSDGILTYTKIYELIHDLAKKEKKKFDTVGYMFYFDACYSGIANDQLKEFRTNKANSENSWHDKCIHVKVHLACSKD